MIIIRMRQIRRYTDINKIRCRIATFWWNVFDVNPIWMPCRTQWYALLEYIHTSHTCTLILNLHKRNVRGCCWVRHWKAPAKSARLSAFLSVWNNPGQYLSASGESGYLWLSVISRLISIVSRIPNLFCTHLQSNALIHFHTSPMCGEFLLYIWYIRRPGRSSTQSFSNDLLSAWSSM